MSHDANSIEARNKQIVQAAFDRWAAGTGNLFEDLAPDAKWTIVGKTPASRTYNSRQEFTDLVIKPFNARLVKPLVPKVRGLYADGDMVVAFFDAAGMAFDGKPYEQTYTWYLRMKDGKIVDAVAFFCTATFNDFWSRIAPARGAGQ